MKKTFAAAAVLLTMTFSSTFAAKIGLVDMQQVFSSSHGVSKIQAHLEKQFSAQRADMLKAMKSLQAKMKDFNKNKSVMSKKAQADARTKLQAAQRQLQKDQNSYQQAVVAAQTKAMKAFVAKIKKAAADVASKDNLDAVYVNNSLLYAKHSVDVTNSVVDDLK